MFFNLVSIVSLFVSSFHLLHANSIYKVTRYQFNGLDNGTFTDITKVTDISLKGFSEINPTTFSSVDSSLSNSGPDQLPYPSIISKTLSDLESLATTMGLIVGGFWVYMNTLRGRRYRPRIESIVSAKICMVHHDPLITVNVCIKNVGMSRAYIDRNKTFLELFEVSEPPSLPWAVEEKDLKPLAMSSPFKQHSWIDPNEQINDICLFRIEKHIENIFLVRLSMASKDNNIEWISSCVAIYYDKS
jgi:hypothetical protein